MKKFKNKLFYFFSGIIYIILAIAVLILSSIFLEPEVKSFFVSTFSANKTGSNDIVEIVIDDTSVGMQGYSWPWKTSMYTELLDYFHTYAKPEIIGFDIKLNIKPERKDDVQFTRLVSKMDNLILPFTPVADISNNSSGNYMKNFRKKYALNTDFKAYEFSPDYYNAERLSDMYIDATKHIASVKIKPNETSGLYLSMINLLRIGDAYYPSLPLKMYLLNNSTNDIIVDEDNIIIPKTKLKIPHTQILNSEISSDIKFYKNYAFSVNGKIEETSYSHTALSAYYIVNSYRNLKAGKPQKDDIPPELFKGKTVFIGANISGPSADVLRTPMGNRHPGVDIQATMYDNIVNGEFLHCAGYGIQFLALLFTALFTFIFVRRFNFVKSLFMVLLFDVLYFSAVAGLAYNNYILSFANPMAIQLITLIYGYSFKFISENRNKEKIKQAMGKYLSQDIMKNVVSNIDDLKLGGKRAVVTVLFSDIRGFTSLSEKMSAEEVSMILNEYFSEMEPIITKYNGVINKFIGDAVMAIFGEPIQDINHAQNAVKCAYEMLKTVDYLREKWLFEGKPKIEIGIGINTGEVFIGNIGTESRMEYTVIGDTVNLASRIESYNKVYKTNLLVSSSTYENISDIADVIKISEVQIRGKAKKMNIYEVLRIDLNKKL